MHDVDRTQLEYGSELFEYNEAPDLASEQYEYPSEQGSVLESIFSEAQAEEAYETGDYPEYQELTSAEFMEDELATEFLEVSNEDELDHFLGKMFRKVAGAAGKVIKSPVGRALGGILKHVAKKALPIAGGALGTFVGGPLGGMVGSKLASMAGNAFGLESEGLSPEDRDFELARRYVRFAGHAARKAALAPPNVHPARLARWAVIDAAKKFAPGLLAPLARGAGVPPRPTAPPAAPRTSRPAAPFADAYSDYGASPAQTTCPTCGVTPARYRRQGKWFRRGRHIILLGA